MSAAHQLDIINEPRGRDYVALLELSLMSCDRFSLVKRSEIEFSAEASRLLEALQPGIISERQVTEWPGTKLYGDSATLYEFRLSHDAVSILSAGARGLYDWQQPSRPEDLVVYRSTGEPWLVSIAHERDGYLLLTTAEHEVLATNHPQLVAMLKQRSH